MSERGVFAVDRGIWTDTDFANEPFTEREAFLWLVGEAAWRPTKVRLGASVISLDRGECAFSTRFMAEKWQWKEARVRRYLHRLENAGMIQISATKSATHLSIQNYGRFQRVSLPSREEATQQRRTDDAPATQQRRKEEDKEYIDTSLRSVSVFSFDPANCDQAEVPQPSAQPKARKPKPEPEGFPEFYDAFPRHVGREAAAKAYARVIAEGKAAPEQLLAGARLYAAERRGKEATYTKHPGPWLNDGRYRDYAETTSGEKAEPKARTAADDAGARTIMRNWQANPHSWPPRSGPRPDEPGCRIPADILAEFGIGPAARSRPAEQIRLAYSADDDPLAQREKQGRAA